MASALARYISAADSDIGGDNCRIASHVFGHAVGNHATSVEDRDPFGQAHDKPHVVLDQQDGYSGALNSPNHTG